MMLAQKSLKTCGDKKKLIKQDIANECELEVKENQATNSISNHYKLRTRHDLNNLVSKNYKNTLRNGSNKILPNSDKENMVRKYCTREAAKQQNLNKNKLNILREHNVINKINESKKLVVKKQKKNVIEGEAKSDVYYEFNIKSESDKGNQHRKKCTKEITKQQTITKSKLPILKDRNISMVNKGSNKSIIKEQKRNIIQREAKLRNKFELEKENPHRNLCVKEIVKQQNLNKSKLSILKEHNVSIKNEELNESTLKNKGENMLKAEAKLKVCNELNTKSDSDEADINYFKPDSYPHCSGKKKLSNDILSKPTVKIPIWNRQLDSKRCSLAKQKSKGDVYDIALDADLMASEERKSKIKPKTVKKKKHIAVAQAKNYKRKLAPCDNLHTIAKSAKLKTAKAQSNVITESVKEKKSLISSNQATSNIPFEEDDPGFLIPFQISDKSIELPDAVDGGNHTTEYTQNKILLDLVDELEKSFVMPKMTSTPDKQGKTGAQISKNKILNIPNISNIINVGKNGINASTIYNSNDSIPNEPSLEKTDKIGDITLFESPTKQAEEKTVKLKLPKKLIQIDLFGELANTPCKQPNLDDSVLKPNKAYHTPNNFKTHLIRVKRSADVHQKTVTKKKSKEQILIEKMTKHFEEVGDTELCIE